MTRFILDTDHISLFQRGHEGIRSQVAVIPPDQLAVTIVSFEEQVRGWLAQLRRTQEPNATVHGYRRLQEALDFFGSVSVLGFDTAAADWFQRLRKAGVRIGTQDLRIASIALPTGSTVVTRNERDFGQVPGLVTSNWT